MPTADVSGSPPDLRVSSPAIPGHVARHRRVEGSILRTDPLTLASDVLLRSLWLGLGLTPKRLPTCAPHDFRHRN